MHALFRRRDGRHGFVAATLIGLGANLGPYSPSDLQRKNHLNVVTKIFIVLVSLLAVLLAAIS